MVFPYMPLFPPGLNPEAKNPEVLFVYLLVCYSFLAPFLCLQMSTDDFIILWYCSIDSGISLFSLPHWLPLYYYDSLVLCAVGSPRAGVAGTCWNWGGWFLPNGWICWHWLTGSEASYVLILCGSTPNSKWWKLGFPRWVPVLRARKVWPADALLLIHIWSWKEFTAQHFKPVYEYIYIYLSIFIYICIHIYIISIFKWIRNGQKSDFWHAGTVLNGLLPLHSTSNSTPIFIYFDSLWNNQVPYLNQIVFLYSNIVSLWQM